MTKKEQPQGRFSDLGIRTKLLAVLTKKGFIHPTPIQEQVIPGALQGQDVIGIAQTGTGKTLAFGLPMIQRLVEHKGQGLILVPTRELALQVEESLKQISGSLGVKTAVIIGGVSQRLQEKALKKNPHFVIATPGRLDDLMKQGLYNLKKVRAITLDEADRMLDVGFLPQIKRVLQLAPKNRQTMLFSATMPKTISSLASKFMQTPLRIEIAPQGTSSKNVRQELIVVNKANKMKLVAQLLKEHENETVLIFSRTKYGAKRIARDIRNLGHTATEIHSNRSQAQRKTALEGFTKKRFRVMVATDIAARGIDVEHITLVINYDLPENSEDYVHRIGRTGRAGRKGKAISFVTTSQKAKVKKIEQLIQKTLPVISHPALPKEELGQSDATEKRSSRGRGSRNHKRSDSRKPGKRKRTRRSNTKSGFGRDRKHRRGRRKKAMRITY